MVLMSSLRSIKPLRTDTFTSFITILANLLPSAQDDGFLTSIDTIMNANTNENMRNRVADINTLLTASENLIKHYKKANRSIFDNAAANSSRFVESQAEDQKRVLEILAAGKRVFEGDLAAIEKQAKGGGDEAAAQAVYIFGEGAEGVAKGSEADMTLKYLDKGVRKIAKGLPVEYSSPAR
jgi:hypothetical protein